MSENRTRFRLDQRRAPIYEALEQLRQMRGGPFACVRAENGPAAPGRNWSYRCFLTVPIGKNDENAVKS